MDRSEVLEDLEAYTPIDNFAQDDNFDSLHAQLDNCPVERMAEGDLDIVNRYFALDVVGQREAVQALASIAVVNSELVKTNQIELIQKEIAL